MGTPNHLRKDAPEFKPTLSATTSSFVPSSPSTKLSMNTNASPFAPKVRFDAPEFNPGTTPQFGSPATKLSVFPNASPFAPKVRSDAPEFNPGTTPQFGSPSTILLMNTNASPFAPKLRFDASEFNPGTTPPYVPGHIYPHHPLFPQAHSSQGQGQPRNIVSPMTHAIPWPDSNIPPTPCLRRGAVQ